MIRPRAIPAILFENANFSSKMQPNKLNVNRSEHLLKRLRRQATNYVVCIVYYITNNLS